MKAKKGKIKLISYSKHAEQIFSNHILKDKKSILLYLDVVLEEDELLFFKHSLFKAVKYGMGVKSLADKMGCTPVTLYKKFNGKAPLRIKDLLVIIKEISKGK